MRKSLLTREDVHRIRISGLSDAHWERELGVSRTAINKARLGVTWQTHPTPPDTEPRMRTVKRNGRPERDSLPQMSQSDRVTSQLLARWPRVGELVVPRGTEISTSRDECVRPER